ncbi:MAG: hypothetical protein QME45_09595 [Clostridiales bacterium]|nr:hypothetical protein [Clostridiales bacterium]
MKKFDMFHMAVKNLKWKWAALPAICIAVSSFCLSFAGMAYTAVNKEKSQPYDLTINAQGNTAITDRTITNILGIPDVKAATPVLQVPSAITAGKYSAQLTLAGIQADYFEGHFITGNIFPDNSVMPYIIINQSACRQFSQTENSEDMAKSNISDKNQDVNNTPDSKSGISKSEKDKSSIPAASSAFTVKDSKNSKMQSSREEDTQGGSDGIDWLNASFRIQNERHPVISRVCGIFSKGDTNQEPAAYISLSAAKELLYRSGQPANIKTAYVRIKNIGCATRVERQISALGFAVTNGNSMLQDKWDSEIKEMHYLLAIGALNLLYFTLFAYEYKRRTIQKRKPELFMLLLVGMKKNDIKKITDMQSWILAAAGISIGIIMSCILKIILKL